jgi:hypothetical protein
VVTLRVLLPGLLIGASGGSHGCGPAQKTHDAGVNDTPDGAPLDFTADREAETSCPVTAPSSRFAAWPLPDPTIRVGPTAQDYDTSSTGVAVDRVTNLVWQRNLDAETYSSSEAGTHCACLDLDGRSGWRLPTRMELISIVDFTRRSPAIDPGVFPGTPDQWFWTSSPVADKPGFVWYIYFETGFSKFIDGESRYRVRCVREADAGSDAKEPPSEHYRVADGNVFDTRTGLTWQQTLDPTMRPWADATATCAALTFAGGGWRLPNMKELQSLVDEARADPALDPTAFPDTPPDSFWTSTRVAGTTDSAWRVSFSQGYAYDENVMYAYRARCVR